MSHYYVYKDSISNQWNEDITVNPAINITTLRFASTDEAHEYITRNTENWGRFISVIVDGGIRITGGWLHESQLGEE